jgi:hypothetical protein
MRAVWQLPACNLPTPPGTVFLAAISTCRQKKLHFSSLFCGFFLAFFVFLGYSPLRPEFFTEKQGVASSAPASIASEWKDKSGG